MIHHSLRRLLYVSENDHREKVKLMYKKKDSRIRIMYLQMRCTEQDLNSVHPYLFHTALWKSGNKSRKLTQTKWIPQALILVKKNWVQSILLLDRGWGKESGLLLLWSSLFTTYLFERDKIIWILFLKLILKHQHILINHIYSVSWKYGGGEYMILSKSKIL